MTIPLFRLAITFPISFQTIELQFITKTELYLLLCNLIQGFLLKLQIFLRTFGGGGYTFFVASISIPTSYTYTYSFCYTRDMFQGAPTICNFSFCYFRKFKCGRLNFNISLLNYMPDMKVSDFFSGILKMFNLTAFSTDGINFTLEQLENWYFLGDIKDFSEYCTTDLDFNRIKPYKKINFEYEKSENLLNRNFFTTNSREYGNLSSTFNTDGSDYSIKLPFENLLFNKFTGTNLQVLILQILQIIL
jgi:hypothetical protein